MIHDTRLAPGGGRVYRPRMAKKSPITQAIGDLTVEYMKRERCFSAMWGDGFLVNVACDAGVTIPHPMNKMAVAIKALSRDKRFDMRLTLGHDSRCRGCHPACSASRSAWSVYGYGT